MQAVKKNKRVVLTGGHAATTALATIEEIVRRHAGDWDIYWIGVKKAFEGRREKSIDSMVMSAKGVTFHSIHAGRLQKKFTRWTLPAIFKIPIGFVQTFYLIAKIRPKAVLSFGGFAAFPVVVAAWLSRVPVILHEQTTEVGRANKFSSFFASKIAVARKSSLKHFPAGKVVVTGNPVMTQILEIEPKPSLASRPTVFITGGSRGSQNLNSLIEPILSDLLQKYCVIHQTGYPDFEKYATLKRERYKDFRYEVYPFIDPMQIDGVYKLADLVIARSGANTVSEVMAVKRPAIFIPIPWVVHDEQRKNAMFAKEFGIAELLDQDSSPEELQRLIEKMFEDWEEMVAKVKAKTSPDVEAASNLVDVLERCAKL